MKAFNSLRVFDLAMTFCKWVSAGGKERNCSTYFTEIPGKHFFKYIFDTFKDYNSIQNQNFEQ